MRRLLLLKPSCFYSTATGSLFISPEWNLDCSYSRSLVVAGVVIYVELSTLPSKIKYMKFLQVPSVCRIFITILLILTVPFAIKFHVIFLSPISFFTGCRPSPRGQLIFKQMISFGDNNERFQ